MKGTYYFTIAAKYTIPYLSVTSQLVYKELTKHLIEWKPTSFNSATDCNSATYSMLNLYNNSNPENEQQFLMLTEAPGQTVTNLFGVSHEFPLTCVVDGSKLYLKAKGANPDDSVYSAYETKVDSTRFRNNFNKFGKLNYVSKWNYILDQQPIELGLEVHTDPSASSFAGYSLDVFRQTYLTESSTYTTSKGYGQCYYEFTVRVQPTIGGSAWVDPTWMGDKVITAVQCGQDLEPDAGLAANTNELIKQDLGGNGTLKTVSSH